MPQQVAVQTPFKQYTANGLTTVFAYDFQVLEAADMVVYADGVLVPSSEYSLSGLGDQAGGSVTFGVAPAADVIVLLSREIALARTTEYQTLGDFKAVVVNPDFNRLWMALQGVGAELGGSVRAPYPEQMTALPVAADRALKSLGFDASGNPTVLTPASGSAADVLTQIANTASAAEGDALVGVKRTFTGAVAGTAHSVHEAQVINAVAYAGMSTAASAAANTTALAVALAAAVALGGGTVEIPAGSYALTAGTNWQAAGVTIRGHGNGTILTFAAAGNAFVLDSGGAGSTCYGMRVEDLRIVGNAGTTSAFYARGQVQMTAKNIEVRECATNGFHLLHNVTCSYESCGITTNRAAQTTKPGAGWRLANAGAGYYTANTTFTNCFAEGFTGTGLVLDDASGNLWVGGTFEGMTGKGIEITSDDCRRNHFVNVWCEANTVNDLIVKGVANQFSGCNFQSATSGDTVSITTGTGTVFEGGFASVVNLGASSGNTHFSGVGFSDNVSLGVTGTGTFTRVGCTRLDTSSVITAKYLDVLGASAAWTPTVSQGVSITGLTIAKNSYRINGAKAMVRAKITCGSAGTGSVAVSIGAIPAAVAILAADVEMPIGRFIFFDASASTYYEGSVIAASVSAVSLQTNNATNAFGTAPAVTIASGDVIYVFMDYEIA